MTNPKDLAFNSIRWDDWVTTQPGRRSYEMEIGCAGYVCFVSIKKLNEKIPGFTFAYDQFAYFGCDKYYATGLLKFFITEANGQPLDTFLLGVKNFDLVTTGLDLGMSVDELGPLLLSAAGPVEGNDVLPDDLFEITR